MPFFSAQWFQRDRKPPPALAAKTRCLDVLQEQLDEIVVDAGVVLSWAHRVTSNFLVRERRTMGFQGSITLLIPDKRGASATWSEVL